jgi:hypothetical protein
VLSHGKRDYGTPSQFPLFTRRILAVSPELELGSALTHCAIRASDLHMKIEYLRSRYSGRAFTGATA